MAEDALLGHRFGLLRHRLQFLNQDICIESSSDLGSQAFDSRDDNFALGLLEQLWQCPRPVEPFVQDLDLLAVIGRDDVVHGPDVAAWIDPDRLTR